MRVRVTPVEPPWRGSRSTPTFVARPGLEAGWSRSRHDARAVWPTLASEPIVSVVGSGEIVRATARADSLVSRAAQRRPLDITPVEEEVPLTAGISSGQTFSRPCSMA